MTMAHAGQTDLPLDQKHQIGTSHQVTVALLGFETAEQERLDRVFQTERPGKRRYIAASRERRSGSDILLVNYDNPAALEEKDRILASHPGIQIVAASRGPLQEMPEHHIRGILIAARVFAVLDKIPASSAIEPVQAASPEPHSVPAVSVQTGYRALVVDDSAAIQKSLELNLATLPQIAAVDFADSGESALAKAETTHYDLIFLDVMMPGIDGYETCAQLRKKPSYKKTPIIMVSGKTSPLDEVKGVMAGCTTYLTKPVQPDAFQKLGARVLAWLERQTML
jgi:two-component system cell cycle response regulator